jgi:nucleoside-diphosphate-sugar epimerase
MNSVSETPLYVRALTRKTQSFKRPWITWVPGDIRNFTDDVPVDLVLHAALPSTSTPPGGELELFDIACLGVEHVMKHAAFSGSRRTMVLSSGAVYGDASLPVSEFVSLGPVPPTDTYARAKREVEAVARSFTRTNHDILVARLFTCFGEGYRSHNHLAHVSLLRQARAGGPLMLKGDGASIRSYLAGEDLGLWLLALLSRRGCDTVNVGSDTVMSIRDLALLVAQCAGLDQTKISFAGESAGARNYFVPDITKARNYYGLEPWTPVKTVVERLLRAQTML